ncbi:hypothetical protein CHLRE_06g256100v5 [Chlamydomonas reinhardtii]|uniref:ATPase AAA-type core domain-containing protein n=1 Tax=Chlamydomonas reinhardtii TaxID=3055 RepID=A0A2K3DME1_CHLRE|nr:uncharacterized protein CHLRE_06g256100v5 [Chlamydomonas reinhardtii]PNW81683.1 hypothetical protein CHLRE_06g256100v5 [Chlamydomonas reinhardtii]
MPANDSRADVWLMVALGGLVLWRRRCLSTQLRESAERIALKATQRAAAGPLTLTTEEMCLESCVKSPGDWELEHLQVFGADPAVVERLDSEVVRALQQPELLGRLGLQHLALCDAHMQPPYLVLLQGPARTGKKSMVLELARTNGITVLHLDKHSLEAAHKAACCWGALGSWWSGGGSVVAAAFSLAKKLQPCIILLDNPLGLPAAMLAVIRAEVKRLRAAPHNWSQERVSVVMTSSASLPPQLPAYVPACHRIRVALPTTQQLGAMLHGFLRLMQAAYQQQQQQQQRQRQQQRQPHPKAGGALLGGGPTPQPQLMAALANYEDAAARGGVAGGPLVPAGGDGGFGAEVHQYLQSLQGRTAPHVRWLALRARLRAAGADGAEAQFQPLTLAHLRAALQDLLAEEHLQQRS